MELGGAVVTLIVLNFFTRPDVIVALVVLIILWSLLAIATAGPEDFIDRKDRVSDEWFAHFYQNRGDRSE